MLTIRSKEPMFFSNGSHISPSKELSQMSSRSSMFGGGEAGSIMDLRQVEYNAPQTEEKP